MFGIRAELSRSQLKRKGEGKSTRNQDYVFEFKINSKPRPSVQFYRLAKEILPLCGSPEIQGVRNMDFKVGIKKI
jgi:hypothetical protein